VRATAATRDLASRRTPRIDFATAPWQRNEHGVDMLALSTCAGTGAVTFALRTPADFHYPERQHFYDCEEELFQLEGDFRHDRVRPYQAGDYVFRPAGTVYGDDEGSDGGGIILASLARAMQRHHFDDHPKPWEGHYLVDRRWNPGREQPFVLSSTTLPWQPGGLDPRVTLRALHGTPGRRRDDEAVFAHSPWAADFTLMLRIEAGFDGPMPLWPGFVYETLACSGRATIGGEAWHRGCYQFGGPTGACIVVEALELYCRVFRDADGPR
jgi:hypothetical protein